jgi:drug/metabolite transporter (DMT)-like permease
VLVVMPLFHLMAYRFVLAVLLLLPLARGVRWTRALLADGLGIGLALFCGFALQGAGLLWTTPSRAAFLTSLSVVLVPLIGLGLGRRLARGPALGVVLAAAGLWVLYRPAAQAPASALHFNRGDALELAGAVTFAVFILLVERAAPRHPLPALAVLEFGLVALLSLPSLVLQPPTARELSGFGLFAVVGMGIFATALAFVLQLYGQRHLSAIEAGVIFTLEPILAALFSIALGAEPWSLSLGAGGALVVSAMLVTELWGGPGDVPPAVAATRG